MDEDSHDRILWAQFACAALARITPEVGAQHAVQSACHAADLMLAETKKRFYSAGDLRANAPDTTEA